MQEITLKENKNKEQEQKWFNVLKWMTKQGLKGLTLNFLKNCLIVGILSFFGYHIGVNFGMIEKELVMKDLLFFSFVGSGLACAVMISHSIETVGLSTSLSLITKSISARNLKAKEKVIKRLNKILEKNDVYKQNEITEEEFFHQTDLFDNYLENKKKIINEIKLSDVTREQAINYSVIIGEEEYKIDDSLCYQRILPTAKAKKYIDDAIEETEEIFDESVDDLIYTEKQYAKFKNVTDVICQSFDGKPVIDENLKNLDILASNTELFNKIYNECKEAADLSKDLQEATKEDLELLKRKILFLKLESVLKEKIDGEQQLALAQMAIEEVEKLETEKSALKPMGLYYKDDDKK